MKTRLTSPTVVRSTLARLGVHPNRTLGQNFLIDANVLGIVMAAAELQPGEHVLEVGPGLGVLTRALVEAGASVVCIEKDARLAGFLLEEFGTDRRVGVVQGDALDRTVPLAEEHGAVKLVANLPYSISSRLLAELVIRALPLLRIVITVQREVADRIVAEPGSRNYGLLSVWLQSRYVSRLVRRVKPTCFWPRPEVDSAILLLTARPEGAVPGSGSDMFFRITKQAFAQRRKQLAGLLRRGAVSLPVAAAAVPALLQECEISPSARAGDLSSVQWGRLVLRAVGGPGKSKIT